MSGTITNPTASSGFDGALLPNNLFGKAGEDVVTELHGKYYTQTYRGAMFWASQTAATVTNIFSSGTPTTLCLWNPQGSGKNLVIARTVYTPVTAASAAVMLGWGIQQNAGAALGTAAPISVFTTLANRGGGLLNQSGGQQSSVALIASGATVTTGATLFVPVFGITTDVITTSSEGTAFVDECEGRMIVQPGCMINFGSSAANTGTGLNAVWWYEAPL